MPGSRNTLVAKHSGRKPQPSERAAAVDAAPIRAALSRLDRKLVTRPSVISMVRRVGVPSSSNAKLPRVPGTVASATTLTAGEPYCSVPAASRPMNERPGEVGLVAQDPVQLERVPGRLVDLQGQLGRPDDDRRGARLGHRGGQQLDGLRADPGRLLRQPQAGDVLPARRGRVAVERVGVAPPLDQLLAAGQGQHHAAGLDEVLLLPRALGAGEVPVAAAWRSPRPAPAAPRRCDSAAASASCTTRSRSAAGTANGSIRACVWYRPDCGRPGRQHDPLAGPGRRRPGVAQGQVGGQRPRRRPRAAAATRTPTRRRPAPGRPGRGCPRPAHPAPGPTPRTAAAPASR